jgi:hypothetical protein
MKEIINQLRIDLVKQGFAFGALFVGIQSGGFELLFADGMPTKLKLELISDLQRMVNDAKEQLLDA